MLMSLTTTFNNASNFYSQTLYRWSVLSVKFLEETWQMWRSKHPVGVNPICWLHFVDSVGLLMRQHKTTSYVLCRLRSCPQLLQRSATLQIYLKRSINVCTVDWSKGYRRNCCQLGLFSRLILEQNKNTRWTLQPYLNIQQHFLPETEKSNKSQSQMSTSLITPHVFGKSMKTWPRPYIENQVLIKFDLP
jgi:hypothetical protein